MISSCDVHPFVSIKRTCEIGDWCFTVAQHYGVYRNCSAVHLFYLEFVTSLCLYIFSFYINNMATCTQCGFFCTEIFSKSMERLQAIIEGSRIRRRLKSRRLQTIVKEIKVYVNSLDHHPRKETCITSATSLLSRI